MKDIYTDNLRNEGPGDQESNIKEEIKLPELKENITNLRIQSQVKNLHNEKITCKQGSNSWSLSQKMIFMQSLSIPDYQDCFVVEGLNIIHEIKFSNDGIFSFICKEY